MNEFNYLLMNKFNTKNLFAETWRSDYKTGNITVKVYIDAAYEGDLKNMEEYIYNEFSGIDNVIITKVYNWRVLNEH